MNPTSIYPTWVAFLAAMLAPAVAVLAATIAWQQWRTAREKLKLDLFDRRLPVYEATRDILSDRMARGTVPFSEINKFAFRVRVSRWLFDAAIAEYLKEVIDKLLDLNSLESEREALTDDTDRKRNIDRQQQIKSWLDYQCYEVMDNRFGRFLHVKHEAPIFASLAFGRGFFRLWVVASIAWLCGVAFFMWPSSPVAWPWSAPPMIHVKWSDTKTLDYPPDWGVARIKDDLRRKVAEENEQDRKWAAAFPSDRKALCDALSKSDTPLDQQPDDCSRLAWMGMGAVMAVPTDWESQFRSPPIPITQVGLMVAPWVFGPPLLLLITGLSLGWIIRGFRAD